MTEAVLTGVAFVLVTSVLVLAARPRRYPTVAELYVAGRTVRPWWNGAAISSEVTAAAACLGTAGLIATHGGLMLWYPVGAAAGFVVVLALVVAPLRRSGAYTLPDFAEWRLRSPMLRRFTTCWVLLIGLLFLVAQLHAAGVLVRLLAGLPPWSGWVAVAAVALAVALSGGLGSATRMQAAQFWLKLVVFVGVALLLWCAWQPPGDLPLPPFAEAGEVSLPGVLTVLLAGALGTMGLPHVVVRVYANPDGRAARRSIVAAQAMLAVFYVAPPLLGILGRVHVHGAGADEVVLLLPGAMVPGIVGQVLTGALAAGAFAAFLATSCGVLVAVAGAVSACVSRAGVRAFRAGVVSVMLAALGVTASTSPGGSVRLVLLGLSLSAATFCPLLVLGIWWRRLTAAGAAAGFAVGGGLTLVLAVGVKVGVVSDYPTPFAVLGSFAAMVLISLVTPGRVPRRVIRMMVRMHVAEELADGGGDRLSQQVDRSPIHYSPYNADY